MSSLPAAQADLPLGESICPYCGVGCRLRLEAAPDDSAPARIRVRGVASHPANRGHLCAKGAQIAPTRITPDRLTQPLMRRSRTAPLQPVSWDAALEFVAQRVRYLSGQHGPECLGFYGSGQLDTESIYVAAKLFKGHLRTPHTDANTRLCMTASEEAYRQSFGADGPPPCNDDLEQADAVLVIGSNLAETHPVLFTRLRAAMHRRGTQLVVIDPRLTRTARQATLHLPVRPGGDVALLQALARRLWEHGCADSGFIGRHCRDFEAYQRELMQPDSPAAGVSGELLDRAAGLIAGVCRRGGNLLSLYCMGLNQSSGGVAKNHGVINLHLMTGQVGRAGAGPFSLTGQPNAMGVREAGLGSESLPGHRRLDDAAHRAEVESHWNLPPGSLPGRPGLTAVELFQALERGELRALWVAATNPLVSLPDLHQVRRAVSRSELVVVHEVYHPTETSRLADVVLPSATWGEKDWTGTNGERRVSFSPRLAPPPGEALPDWEILCRLARKLQLPGFDYPDAAAVWDDYAALTRGRPCDLSGMTAERLRRVGSLQWPCPDANHPGSERLYTDRRFATPDGKARFVVHPAAPAGSAVAADGAATAPAGGDPDFPFVLTSGRIYGHWHTLTRTGKVPPLIRSEPHAYVEVHPDDAARLNVREGDLLQITSRRGTIQLPARLEPGVQPGAVFVPFHWGDLFGEGNALNYLTAQSQGPQAKHPDFKVCRVHLSRAATPQQARQAEEARALAGARR